MKLSHLFVAFLAALLFAAPCVSAQPTYPDRPVRIIVGFPAGSATDTFARLFADKLSQQFKNRFVVENIPGNASNNGAVAAARAQPDGTTLLFATNANAISVSLYKQLRYRFPGDFDPIALVATTPQLLVVNPSFGFNSTKELIAAAKAKPGEIASGHGGVGGGPHLAAELFSLMADVKLTHVPYKATNEAMSDLLAGRIAMTFSTMPIVRGFLADGRLKALGITSDRRMALAPNIPTMAETGVPNVEVIQWFGFMAPKGTPPEIIKAVGAAVEVARNADDVKQKIADNGGEPRTESGADFLRFIESDIRAWSKAVEHAGVKID